MEICYVNITKHNYEKSTSYILQSVQRIIKKTSEHMMKEVSRMHALCGKCFLLNYFYGESVDASTQLNDSVRRTSDNQTNIFLSINFVLQQL